MGFMVPVAEYFAMYVVETSMGTEFVPEDVSGKIVDLEDEGEWGILCPYLEGKDITSVKRVKGWWSRLSAPGYMDATDWMGAYKTAEEALAAVKDEYEVDDDGDSLTDDE